MSTSPRSNAPVVPSVQIDGIWHPAHLRIISPGPLRYNGPLGIQMAQPVPPYLHLQIINQPQMVIVSSRPFSYWDGRTIRQLQVDRMRDGGMEVHEVPETSIPGR
ncbi:MAG: hypothetical protein RLY78_157 [Pseudomonadota bacterium]